MNLQQQITSLVEAKLDGTGNYLVEVKVSPSKITVILDHPKSLSLDSCVVISRHLHEVLEETDIFEKHELEVTSPGMEEPLQVLQQYLKRLNHRVGVITFDGLKRTGKLISATQEGIEIEEEISVKLGNKRSTELRLLSLSFNQIKETRVIFSFDKINPKS